MPPRYDVDGNLISTDDGVETPGYDAETGQYYEPNYQGGIGTSIYKIQGDAREAKEKLERERLKQEAAVKDPNFILPKRGPNETVRPYYLADSPDPEHPEEAPIERRLHKYRGGAGFKSTQAAGAAEPDIREFPGPAGQPPYRVKFKKEFDPFQQGLYSTITTDEEGNRTAIGPQIHPNPPGYKGAPVQKVQPYRQKEVSPTGVTSYKYSDPQGAANINPDPLDFPEELDVSPYEWPDPIPSTPEQIRVMRDPKSRFYEPKLAKWLEAEDETSQRLIREGYSFSERPHNSSHAAMRGFIHEEALPEIPEKMGREAAASFATNTANDIIDRYLHRYPNQVRVVSRDQNGNPTTRVLKTWGDNISPEDAEALEQWRQAKMSQIIDTMLGRHKTTAEAIDRRRRLAMPAPKDPEAERLAQERGEVGEAYPGHGFSEEARQQQDDWLKDVAAQNGVSDKEYIDLLKQQTQQLRDEQYKKDIDDLEEDFRSQLATATTGERADLLRDYEEERAAIHRDYLGSQKYRGLDEATSHARLKAAVEKYRTADNRVRAQITQQEGIESALEKFDKQIEDIKKKGVTRGGRVIPLAPEDRERIAAIQRDMETYQQELQASHKDLDALIGDSHQAQRELNAIGNHEIIGAFHPKYHTRLAEDRNTFGYLLNDDYNIPEQAYAARKQEIEDRVNDMYNKLTPHMQKGDHMTGRELHLLDNARRDLLEDMTVAKLAPNMPIAEGDGMVTKYRKGLEDIDKMMQKEVDAMPEKEREAFLDQRRADQIIAKPPELMTTEDVEQLQESTESLIDKIYGPESAEDKVSSLLRGSADVDTPEINERLIRDLELGGVLPKATIQMLNTRNAIEQENDRLRSEGLPTLNLHFEDTTPGTAKLAQQPTVSNERMQELSRLLPEDRGEEELEREDLTIDRWRKSNLLRGKSTEYIKEHLPSYEYKNLRDYIDSGKDALTDPTAPLATYSKFEDGMIPETAEGGRKSPGDASSWTEFAKSFLPSGSKWKPDYESAQRNMLKLRNGAGYVYINGLGLLRITAGDSKSKLPYTDTYHETLSNIKELWNAAMDPKLTQEEQIFAAASAKQAYEKLPAIDRGFVKSSSAWVARGIKDRIAAQERDHKFGDNITQGIPLYIRNVVEAPGIIHDAQLKELDRKAKLSRNRATAPSAPGGVSPVMHEKGGFHRRFMSGLLGGSPYKEQPMGFMNTSKDYQMYYQQQVREATEAAAKAGQPAYSPATRENQIESAFVSMPDQLVSQVVEEMAATLEDHALKSASVPKGMLMDTPVYSHTLYNFMRQGNQDIADKHLKAMSFLTYRDIRSNITKEREAKGIPELQKFEEFLNDHAKDK